ncbi:hypothetical protein BGW37DRAFT_518196 [Umbelopsis sp. PMI_123]|nr:hypothetical protein BGW37DRAFT_518196 [Umbelopsis sp. PMI_123]
MLSDNLGDHFGYRMIYLTGMALFVIGSVVNAVAPNEYVIFAWHFQFLVGSGPVGFVLGLLVGGALSHQRSAKKVDVVGFFLVKSGFILLIYALSDGQWHLARGPVTVVVGGVVIAAFMLWS